jgi:type II secretory pathway predicted ATPase ExeA
MYRAFFGLGEAPFRITPDPRFLHHDPVVDAALSAISTGIAERAGLMLLVGEVGTGKTTLVRRLLDSLPERVRTVLVLHPTIGFDEILDHVLLELGIPVAGAARDVLLERLADFLREHARDGDVVVFFDEAQALREATLGGLPDLLELVVDGGRPALQIVLAGQPELDGRLATPALARLRSRVAVTARLEALSRDRVASYIRARLERAQARDLDLFTPDALDRIAACSQGIPRVINVLCENALVAAFAEGQQRITGPLIEAVWADYAPLHHPEGTPMPSPPPDAGLEFEPASAASAPRARGRQLALAAAAVAALALIPLLAIRPWQRAALPPPAVPAAVPTPPPPEPTPETVPPDTIPEEPAPPADVALPPRAAPPSTLDAVDVVDRFWRAYQARDPAGVRALFAADAIPEGKILDLDPTGGGTLVEPAARLEAKPMGDRVTVRVPFLLTTHDDHGRAVRRQGVATWEIAMRDGTPRIVALASESGPVPRR